MVGEGSRMDDLCAHCGEMQRCILSTLKPEELAIWKTLFVNKSFRKGDIIFWEDEEAEGLYLLCSGAVKLVKAIENGDQQIVRLIGPGGFFGLPSLVSEKTHFCTCRAIDQAQLRFVSRRPFLDFLETFPGFTFQLIGKLAEELGLTRLRLLESGLKNGRQRIAALLLWLGKEFGRSAPAGIEVDIDLPRADLASLAGLTTETTIRILSSFRQGGMIADGHRKRIILRDQAGLQSLAGNGQQPNFDRAWLD